jgi:hypothetical protein
MRCQTYVFQTYVCQTYVYQTYVYQTYVYQTYVYQWRSASHCSRQSGRAQYPYGQSSLHLIINHVKILFSRDCLTS